MIEIDNSTETTEKAYLEQVKYKLYAALDRLMAGYSA